MHDGSSGGSDGSPGGDAGGSSSGCFGGGGASGGVTTDDAGGCYSTNVSGDPTVCEADCKCPEGTCTCTILSNPTKTYTTTFTGCPACPLQGQTWALCGW
jgi:hypothetical protein